MNQVVLGQRFRIKAIRRIDECRALSLGPGEREKPRQDQMAATGGLLANEFGNRTQRQAAPNVIESGNFRRQHAPCVPRHAGKTLVEQMTERRDLFGRGRH